MSLVTRRKMRDGYHEVGIGNDISVADTHVPSNIFVVLHKGYRRHVWNYLCLWLPIGPRWTFIWHWLAFLLLFGLVVKVSVEGDGLVHEHEVGGSCCSTPIPPREPLGTVCCTAYSLPCSFRTKTAKSEQNEKKKAPCNDSRHNRISSDFFLAQRPYSDLSHFFVKASRSHTTHHSL